jgi:hypothetical protein
MRQDTLHAKLVFLHPVGSAGHVVHSSASEAQNGDAVFFMLGWDWYGIDKKCVGTHYGKVVFLQLVGSVGHVVHFGVSGERNLNALFFMLGWAWCGFCKKCTGTRYAELVFFASGGIHGSHSDVQLNTSDTSTPTHNQISGSITRAHAR